MNSIRHHKTIILILSHPLKEAAYGRRTIGNVTSWNIGTFRGLPNNANLVPLYTSSNLLRAQRNPLILNWILIYDNKSHMHESPIFLGRPAAAVAGHTMSFQQTLTVNYVSIYLVCIGHDMVLQSQLTLTGWRGN